MSCRLNIWLAVVIALLGVAGFAWQRGTRRQLERELSQRREAVRAVDRLRDENRRLRALLANPNSKQTPQPMPAEIAKMHDGNGAEARARQAQGQPAGSGPAVSPPTESATAPPYTRLDQFQNAGQATPAAAFQTLVWAVVKGEETTLAGLLRISPSSRERLTAIWNELPPESQAKFKEPVQLVTLLLAMDMLDEDGYEITGQTPQANGEVLLRVERFKRGTLQGEKRIPLQPGPSGWQFVIPDHVIETLPEAIAQASLYVAPSRR